MNWEKSKVLTPLENIVAGVCENISAECETIIAHIYPSSNRLSRNWKQRWRILHFRASRTVEMLMSARAVRMDYLY